MLDIYEGLSEEEIADLDCLDDEANAQMAEAEGRWIDGGCAYLSY